MSNAPALRFCPACAAPLAWIEREEDGGPKSRLRCTACEWTHWNNPTPVLAAVIECTDQDGRILLARNAEWPQKMFGLVAGFMEAGESPEAGIRREVVEETALTIDRVALIGVYDFQRMNQLIVAYHVTAYGPVRLSPELAEYRLVARDKLRCWPQGTGAALADWLRSAGHEPIWLET